MKEAGHYDALTGLPDRGYLWSLLDTTIKQIRRTNRNSGVLLVELDDLDDIEGILGKHGLEEYIRKMAGRIQNCLWDMDIVVHFEPHQFVVVANSIQKQEDIHIVLSKVHEYLSLDCEIDGRKIEPKASIGVVLLPSDAAETDEVMTNAQTALQMAKALGGNSYCYFNQSLGDKIAEQETIKKSILETLAEESFVLMLQPKINTETRKICGAEALVRMLDSDGNIVAPGEFIPVAENSNLILKIGDWVLNKAQALTNELIKQEINIPVSVNISDVQFKNGASLLATLHKLVEENDNIASNIILEISENIITNDVELAKTLMAEIKAIGYQISIDGFGSGFSSLSVLSDLKIDEIKVDRHFLSNVPNDEKNTAILKSIIMLGKAMDFRVVVMGVENESQFDILQQHQCDEFQGFLVSAPMKAGKFVSWYKEYSPKQL